MVDKYLKAKGEKLSLGEFAGGRQGGRAGMGRGRMGWEEVQMMLCMINPLWVGRDGE